MKANTVIFDLDGTLLNTLDDLTNGVNYAMRAAGVPEHTRDEVRRFVGNGYRKLFERAMPGGAEDPKLEWALERFRRYYRAHSAECTRPYDGVTELLRTLREKGFDLAVVSNKGDDAVGPLVRRYFGALLPVAIGETALVRRKPAPDTLDEALRSLGRTRAEAVYVGDSEVDIQTARNAGIPCVSVTWGFRSREELDAAGAEHCADTPAEVLEWLLQQEEKRPVQP